MHRKGIKTLIYLTISILTIYKKPYLMAWKVIVHKLVKKEDYKNIDSSIRKRIKKAIKDKLSSHPDKYGEPLHGPFKIYRKLVVGGYRVIYRIDRNKILVLVIKVGIRRDYEVYKQLFARLQKI